MNPVLARRLTAVGSALALCVMVLTANMVRIGESPVSARVASGWGPAALGKVRRQLIGLQLGQKEIDEGAARRALVYAPLASEPFALLAAKGLAQDPRGHGGQESALLTEALRRDPRSRTARILSLRNRAATGDLRGAFGQLDVLFRLSPGLVNQAMDTIARLIDSPQRMDLALSALSGHPNLYEPFISSLVGKNRSRDVIVRMAQGLPTDVLAKPAARASLVGQLVDVREFALARSIWQRGNPPGSNGLVFSPDFSDHRTAPPFNWQMLVSTAGSAAFGKNRGLSVVYYDRSPGRLALQIVTLPPGRYRLAVEFQLISGTADNVRLQIACYGASGPLADLALYSSKPGFFKTSALFDVPALGCNGQDLAIVGVATARRSETEVEVRRVDIMRGEAS